MQDGYILYFDSGTTNTRAYLLNADLEVCHVIRRGIGSKDSAISGSNKVLVDCLCDMYHRMLEENHLSGDSIKSIYASGMVTSPYGLHEVPHLTVPLDIRKFAESLYRFRESSGIGRDIWLIPGLKTDRDDFSFAGNMRGEEIEIIGAMDELKKLGIHDAALMLPGSHTHIAYVKNDTVADIVSNFTGELFHALKSETVLAPVMDCVPEALDEDMIRLGADNCRRFGFNRAIYICRAMRIMNKYLPEQRFAYCEGVVNGGLGQILEYYLRNIWSDCKTVVLISDEFMYKLLSVIVSETCGELVRDIIWLRADRQTSYSVGGLKRIINVTGEKQ